MSTPDLGPEGIERSKVIATELIVVMGLDNGVTFTPFRAQVIRLTNAVLSLLEDGLEFTEADIKLIVCGEESEAQAAYGKFYGYTTLKNILTNIFDGPQIL